METTIYHILSRGVDKRKIFMDDEGYLRFIHDLFEFNDREPALNIGYLFKNQKNQYIDLRSQYIDIGKKNFPSVTQREFLNEFFERPEQYKKDTLKWLKEMDLGNEEIKKLILE